MRTLAKLFAVLIVVGIVQLPAKTQELPGKHPGYIHALSDLRSARWLLDHQPGDPKVYAGEDVAITETDVTQSGMTTHIPRISILTCRMALLYTEGSLEKGGTDFSEEVGGRVMFLGMRPKVSSATTHKREAAPESAEPPSN